MVCEDGGGAQYVFGVTVGGEVYPVARNAEDIGQPGAPEWGVRRGDLLPRRADDVRQRLRPGDHVRGDRPLAVTSHG